MKNTAELKMTGSLSSRELATVLAALRNWQETLTNLGLGDRSSQDVAKALETNLPHFDHFADEKPLTVNQVDSLCARINLDPKRRIVSINLDPNPPLPADDSAILDQIEDLMVNQFGEDERDDISGDDTFELLRVITDDLLDSRGNKPAESQANGEVTIPKACECDNTHRLNETICGFCWNTKVKPYIDHGGVECPFCYSGNIEGGQVEVDAGTAHQPMRCTDCDAE